MLTCLRMQQNVVGSFYILQSTAHGYLQSQGQGPKPHCKFYKHDALLGYYGSFYTIHLHAGIQTCKNKTFANLGGDSGCTTKRTVLDYMSALTCMKGEKKSLSTCGKYWCNWYCKCKNSGVQVFLLHCNTCYVAFMHFHASCPVNCPALCNIPSSAKLWTLTVLTVYMIMVNPVHFCEQNNPKKTNQFCSFNHKSCIKILSKRPNIIPEPFHYAKMFTQKLSSTTQIPFLA